MQRASSNKQKFKMAKSNFLDKQWKHSSWYIGTSRTNKDILKELASSNDFIIGIKKSRKYMNKSFYPENVRTTSEAKQHLINSKQFDALNIVFTGSEKGTASGKNKVKTFIDYKRKMGKLF